MNKTKGRVIVGALLLFGAVVFGVGINWGLPSSRPDGYFFDAKSDANVDSTLAFRTSGAGIDHLAGDWGDDPSRAADVAEHPITGRDQPVTLVQNLHGLTQDQILAKGDPKLSRLLDQRNSLWKKWTTLGQNPNTKDSQLSDVQTDYAKAEDAIRKEEQEYNATNVPGYSAGLTSDGKYQAQIVRRYRLYSYQPDEMITFRALAQIHPSEHQFDPKLYQYGGLWFYPLGAIVEGGWYVGSLMITPDRGFYLDHPDEFAKLYIVARAYSGVWGLIGMLAVFAIVRKTTGGYTLAVVASVLFVCMPAVLDLAHEAKPHLPGVSLLLLAVLYAMNYVRSGAMRWGLLSALAIGAAAGMVLSAAVGVVIIPLMVLLSYRAPHRELMTFLLGLAIALAVYFAVNPYVAVHLLHHDNTGVLHSNFANSKAMYAYAPSLLNAAQLLAVAASPLLLVAGIIGAVVLLIICRKVTALDWLLGVPALIILIGFVSYAGDKPGEYARFALFPAVALMLAAIGGIGRIFPSAAARAVAGAILIVVTVIYSFSYERGFVLDSLNQGSRPQVAGQLKSDLDSFATTQPTLFVDSEPAPYCLPPVDLYRWKIVLLPPGSGIAPTTDATQPGVYVRPDQSFNVWDPRDTPMSWANIPFTVKRL